MLWRQFKVQCRVIRALIVREVLAHYGRHGLGAGWVLVEPLTFAVPVLLLWSAVRAPFEHGVALMPVLWTGYMGVLLFRHIGGRILFFIRHNGGLLYHRNVTILDIFAARCLVEIAQNLASAFIIFLLFYALDALKAPRDLPLLFEGYFFMIWWCVAVGLFIGAMCERTEWVEKIWQPYAYTYLFYGGFLFMADWLPPGLRTFALYQPSVQAYEMMRAGMLGDAVRTYYDPGYDTFVLAILTLFGLAELRTGRRFARVE